MYNAAIKKTQHFKICEKTEFEKKCLNIKKKLEIYQLVLEKKPQAFEEKIALKAGEYNLYTKFLSNFYLKNSHFKNTSIN